MWVVVRGLRHIVRHEVLSHCSELFCFAILSHKNVNMAKCLDGGNVYRSFVSPVGIAPVVCCLEHLRASSSRLWASPLSPR